MTRYTVRGSDPETGATLRLTTDGDDYAASADPNAREVSAETLEGALTMAEMLAGCDGVRIFADGQPLPSYGEALAQREEVLAEVNKALAYAEGGQRVAKPPALSGASRGALLAIREMLRGAR